MKVKQLLEEMKLYPVCACHTFNCSCTIGCYYASPSSGEAYRDRRLTTNFELWVEIFCVPTCFHVRIPKPCPSVCPYPEKRNHLSFVNISPTLVIDTSMEWSSRVLHHGNQIFFFFFFFKKVWNWIWLVLKSWNQHSSRSHLYVDIGDASSSLWGSTSS